MFSSAVTFFKWMGYVIIAILLIVCGIALTVFFSVAGIAAAAVGLVYVVAFVISHWDKEIIIEDKKSPQ